jgi:hypothetical protein
MLLYYNISMYYICQCAPETFVVLHPESWPLSPFLLTDPAEQASQQKTKYAHELQFESVESVRVTYLLNREIEASLMLSSYPSYIYIYICTYMYIYTYVHAYVYI